MSKKERDSSNRSNKSLYIHTYLILPSLFDLYIIIIIIAIMFNNNHLRQLDKSSIITNKSKSNDNHSSVSGSGSVDSDSDSSCDNNASLTLYISELHQHNIDFF